MTRRSRTNQSVERRLDTLESTPEHEKHDPPELTDEERVYLNEMFGPPEEMEHYTMEDRRECWRELEACSS